MHVLPFCQNPAWQLDTVAVPGKGHQASACQISATSRLDISSYALDRCLLACWLIAFVARTAATKTAALAAVLLHQGQG
jgi:hypothetical protein